MNRDLHVDLGQYVFSRHYTLGLWVAIWDIDLYAS